jgi:CRISPR-associated protein Cmr6
MAKTNELRNLDKLLQQKGIEFEPTEASQLIKGRVLKPKTSNQPVPLRRKVPPPPSFEDVPMMYRAQFSGRCNLMYAREGGDLKKWEKQWLNSSNNGLQYQYEEIDAESQKEIHSFEIKFPYRVLSNSGQDSILRPVIDVHGIPIIPGSSIKGLLRRLCLSRQLSQEDEALVCEYCGTQEKPGIIRFHGAYPIGNWGNKMIDVVHPQQDHQVEGKVSTSASPLVSFFEPTFIFEFSSPCTDIDWAAFKELLDKALTQGLGGKTSSGYGFAKPPLFTIAGNPSYDAAKHIPLQGEGVSSLLLTGQPEFRPHLFKATLRGHLRRLLAGVSNNQESVELEANRLFGSTDNEGAIQIFWEDQSPPSPFNEIDRPPTYTVKGVLHISADSTRAKPSDLALVEHVLKFAYMMGGFGKSWRRVWHKKFYPSYKKFAIGCHWECSNLSAVQDSDNLTAFLGDLHTYCQTVYGKNYVGSLSWREAWSPSKVAVFCKETQHSQAVELFHDNTFKTTLAIGGRKEVGAPTSVSSVWHRMLPISNGQYLEIVTVFHTVFHGDRTPWNRNHTDQLIPFTKELKKIGMSQAWGNTIS